MQSQTSKARRRPSLIPSLPPSSSAFVDRRSLLRKALTRYSWERTASFPSPRYTSSSRPLSTAHQDTEEAPGSLQCSILRPESLSAGIELFAAERTLLSSRNHTSPTLAPSPVESSALAEPFSLRCEAQATLYPRRLSSPPLLAFRLRRAFCHSPSSTLALATSTDSSLMSVTETSSESYTKTWKLSWSFEADLRKEADVELESAPVLLDLSGKWCLYGERDADSSTTVRLGIRWDGALRGAVGSTGVKIVHRLYAVNSPRSTLIQEIQEDEDEDEDEDEVWPSFVSGYTDRIRVDEARLEELDVSPETQRSWRLEVQLTTHDINTVKRCTIFKAAALITSLHGRPVVTQNVRLYFPKTNLELWTTSTLLSASPFYRALFKSGFAEASTTKKRKRTAGAAASQSVVVGEDALAFEDSDDEADELYLEQEQEQPSVDVSEAEFREVRISATAYSTYRALLAWLAISHIDFAPLSSSFKPGNPGEATSGQRSGDLDDFRKAQPDLPLLVSPKSVYRLAHFLELPDLQAIALRAYKSHLDKHIVAYELVSDVSAVYDELRFAALDVAAKDFACVKTGEAMKEITKAMEDDEALALRLPR